MAFKKTVLTILQAGYLKRRHNPMMVSLQALLSILVFVIYSEVGLTLDSQP